jgi:hypothetical protein
MNDIDFLEHGGGSAALMLNGDLIALPDPTTKHYQWVLMALALEYVPGTPGDIPHWKHEQVFDRWRAAWDLPTFNEGRRLAYLVDHYRAALNNDLRVHAGVDLGALWRARRWVTLLDLVDRLPSHSHYSATVANDEEHAKLIAKAIAERKAAGEQPEDNGPALTTWTPEVAVMTQVLDAVNQVRYAVVATQVGKKAGDPPKPARRPVTALEKAARTAELRRRKAAHDSLVARVLPHKAAVKS